MKIKSYAVITGASKGLGKAFAYELAERKFNLILISLSNEGLKELTEELNKRGSEAIPYETDLSKKTNLIELSDWINKNYAIHMLINNAGLGGGKHFLDVDIDYLDKLIQLNIRAVSVLTRLLLPNLLQQEKSYLLNISSLAALSPMAYKTIYPASKAFIYNFTRSLQQEFSETSLNVSVVNPGPMKTNGNVSARIEKQGLGAKLILLSPEEVAKISITKLLQGKKVIKLNWMHRISWILLQIVPSAIGSSILSRSAKKGILKEGRS